MRKGLLKKTICAMLALSMTVVSFSGNGILVSASVVTDADDGKVTNTGSVSGAKGKWYSDIKNPTLYRVYPVVLKDPDTQTKDYTLKYKEYYKYRDLALYEVGGENKSKALEAYTFKGTSNTTGKKVKDMLLGKDDKYDFSQIGVLLKGKLQTQLFNMDGKHTYKAWSDVMLNSIKTDADSIAKEPERSIINILESYIDCLESRKSKLNATGKKKLKALENIVHYGEADFASNAKKVGLCFEVCSISSTAGKTMVFSYGDLLYTSVKNDAWSVWQVLNEAEEKKQLITWSAKYVEKGYKVTPQYNGNIVFCSFNAEDSNKFAQSLSGVVAYKDDVKANIFSGTENTVSVNTTTTSKKNPETGSKIGDSKYTKVIKSMNTASNTTGIGYTEAGLISTGKDITKSLINTKGSTYENNKLGIDDSSKTAYGVNGTTQYKASTIKSNDLYLSHYANYKIKIKANSGSLTDMVSAGQGLEDLLSQVKAKSVASVVSNSGNYAFGNQYSISFVMPDGSGISSKIKETVGNKYGKGATSVTGVTTVRAEVEDGELVNQSTPSDTVKLVSNVNASTLMASSIKGDVNSKGVVQNESGTSFMTVNYLTKRTSVKSSISGMQLMKDKIDKGTISYRIGTNTAVKSKDYVVAGNYKFDVNKKKLNSIANVKKGGSSYILVWKASEGAITDELKKGILNKINEAKLNKAIFDKKGVSVLADAFKATTGKSLVACQCVGSGNNIDTSVKVGAIAKNKAGDLTGYNILVISSDYFDVPAYSEDLIKSDELNAVYPNLLGRESSMQSILPMYPISNFDSVTVTDVIKGDLYNFRGTNVLYYNPFVGLFDIAKKNPKTFDSICYPSYAYNISRAVFNDISTVSNYRGVTGDGSQKSIELQQFAKNILGHRVGDVGTISSVTAGLNIDKEVDIQKSDNYKFNGLVRQYYYYRGIRYIRTLRRLNEYNILHRMENYEALNKKTAENENAYKAVYTRQNKAYDCVLGAVDMSDKVLELYPEVPMKMYYPDVRNGIIRNVSPMIVYVMGEKARSFMPSSLRGVHAVCNNNKGVAARGKVSSDTALTNGADSKLGRKHGNLQVFASEGDVTYGIKPDTTINIVSYTLDITSAKLSGQSVRNDFSANNKKFVALAEHEDYVSTIKDSLQTKVMIISTLNNKKYDMHVSSSEPKVTKKTISEEISMVFEGGSFTKDSKEKVYKSMMKNYDITKAEAVKMFDNAGFEDQVRKALETNIDEDNASANRWYDEESITICLDVFKTGIAVDNIIINDKVPEDVRSDSSQPVSVVKAYLSFVLPERMKHGKETIKWGTNNKILNNAYIEGTDFLLSVTSTADLRGSKQSSGIDTWGN